MNVEIYVAIALVVLGLAVVPIWNCGISAREIKDSDKPERARGAEIPPEIDGYYNIANPFPGIYTSGELGPGDYSALHEAGIRTTIHLQTEGETDWDESDKAEEAGLEYLHLPIRGRRDLDREAVETFDTHLENASREILVYCASSNRVGALFALRAAWKEGETTERAIAIGKRAGLAGLEDDVREILE